MRIMVIGPTDADSFADNVSSTLRRMGHDALAVGGARRPIANRRIQNAVAVVSDKVAGVDLRQQHRLVKACADYRPDLVITVDGRLRPPIVQGLREHAKVVLWFPDHVSNLGRHEMFIAGYDRIYFKNRFLVDQLRGLHGLPVRYLPEAANPEWHRPIGDYGTESHIVVAGNLHPTRAVLLDRLLQANIPLRIYGPPLSGWLDFPRVRDVHSGEYVAREEKARAFRAASGVLNNLHPAEFSGSNCRLFEATACGAATITEWRQGMEDLFDREGELLAFGDFDSLLDACETVLAAPESARSIADAAATRSAREHTYDQRLTEMFVDLGL